MRDPGRMEPRHLAPQRLERLVAHLIGRGPLEWLEVRFSRDEHCVVIRPEADRDDVGHTDTRAFSHQQRKRLVLDLLAPAGGHALRRISVGERPPAAG